MRCEDLVGLIIDYTEGSMSPVLKKEFECHIDDCSSCLAFFDTYKKTSEITKTICCEDIPPDVKERLELFLKKKMGEKNS